MSNLDLRNEMNKRKPKFIRQDNKKKKRIKSNWRKPRGIDSKLRLQFRGHAVVVKVGYKAPADVRGMNREGLIEIKINNVQDLKQLDEKSIGVVASTVGMKKKLAIIEEANKINVKLSNADDSTVKKIDEILKNKKTIKANRKKKLADREKAAKELKKAAKEAKKSEAKANDEKSDAEKKKERDKELIKKDAI